MGSEKALQEVAALLEKEATRGAITPEVEKKVLGVSPLNHRLMDRGFMKRRILIDKLEIRFSRNISIHGN